MQMERSVRILGSPLLIPGTYPSSQKDSCERNRESGCPLLIPQQIIILPARPTTREQRPGFFKAVFSNSGSPLLRSCGSMENVLSFSSPNILHP